MLLVRVALAVLALCLLAAVPALAQQPGADEPPSRRVAEQRPAQLTCGDLSFPPAALGNKRGFQRAKGPLGRALGRFVRKDAYAVGQPKTGWFLAAHEDDLAVVLSGTLRKGYGVMTFKRERGRWSWRGSGGCRPRTFDNGHEAVGWRPRAGAALPPETTRVPVLVQEQRCASGRDARGRIISPLVHYGPTTITVTYFVRPLEGGQNCQGVPETPATLVLDEPLNGRTLLDGGPYPARTPREPR
jgi:hypothetical protein